MQDNLQDIVRIRIAKEDADEKKEGAVTADGERKTE